MRQFHRWTAEITNFSCYTFTQISSVTARQIQYSLKSSITELANSHYFTAQEWSASLHDSTWQLMQNAILIHTWGKKFWSILIITRIILCE
jgi:hypothetical protein